MRATILILTVVLAATAAQAETQALFDKQGHFIGNVTFTQDTAYYTDKNGNPIGTIVKNGDGTFTLYNNNGAIVGTLKPKANPAQP